MYSNFSTPPSLPFPLSSRFHDFYRVWFGKESIILLQNQQQCSYFQTIKRCFYDKIVNENSFVTKSIMAIDFVSKTRWGTLSKCQVVPVTLLGMTRGPFHDTFCRDFHQEMLKTTEIPVFDWMRADSSVKITDKMLHETLPRPQLIFFSFILYLAYTW